MRLDQHLIHLFGNIPYLPKAEIIKHIGIFDLLKMALIDNNWKAAIEKHLQKDKPTLHIILRTRENVTVMKILEERYNKRCQEVQIKWIVNCDLSRRSPVVLRLNRLIEFYSESFDTFERDIIAVVNELRRLVDLDFFIVNLNLNFGISFEFLKSLNLTEVTRFSLEGKCQVDSRELEEIIKKFGYCKELILRVPTTQRFKGVEKFLVDQVEFPDAKWITTEMLLQDEIITGTFKNCQLTGKDFNRIFRKWQRGDLERVSELYFECDKRIIWFDVIKGLKTKPWNPKVRQQKKIRWHVADDPMRIVDLADGLDFKNCSGLLATIHLSKDQKILQFHEWGFGSHFRLNDFAESYVKDIQLSEKQLSREGLSEDERYCYEELKEKAAAKLKHFHEEMERS